MPRKLIFEQCLPFFFYLTLPFIYLIAALPFGLLYIFSDFLFFCVFHLAGYRKKIVLSNLQKSFPKKSEEEIHLIAKKFYRHLCDLLVESFKMLLISKEEMKRRCFFSPEVKKIFDEYNAAAKSMIVVMGHSGNWEWGGFAFNLWCSQKLNIIYHPLTNPYFNRFMIRLRSRFGSNMIVMNDTYREMARRKIETSVTVFVADQTPLPQNAYWTNFLNQDTPFFWGTEKIARKMNYPVIYLWPEKKSRGIYEIHGEMISENSSATDEGRIMEDFVRKLERDIRKQPETWLWSHRRWKHKRPLANQTAVKKA